MDFFNNIRATYAFSQRPLSRAFRSFTGPVLEGREGSSETFGVRSVDHGICQVEAHKRGEVALFNLPEGRRGETLVGVAAVNQR
jgi:hypothetical protein